MKKIFWYKKIKLYGAGHPQLPNIFGVTGSKKNRDEFFSDHETTHAKFEKIDGRTLNLKNNTFPIYNT